MTKISGIYYMHFCAKTLVVICFFSTSLISFPVWASEGRPAGVAVDGLTDVRIEHEGRMIVPSDKTEEVWNHLRRLFLTNDSFLKKLDPGFSAYFSEEYFADVYFDTPDFRLLSTLSSVRHRKRTNLSDPQNRKSGRELVQIKLSGISDDAATRGEIKFQVKTQPAYQSKTPDDWHPLIGLVRKNERERLKLSFTAIGVDPYLMKPVVILNQRRRRIYIQRDEKILFSLSLDEAGSRCLWAKVRFSEIEPEINEIAYTASDSEGRKRLENVHSQIVHEIYSQLPYLKEDLTPKYNKIFTLLEHRVPFFRHLTRTNLTP